MTVIPIQVTAEGVLIPKTYLGQASQVEVVMTDDFVLVRPKPRPTAPDLARFWASLGAWQDDRPLQATLRDIHDARRSRREPPAL